MSQGIDPDARIDPSAPIGEGASIGPFAVIEGDVEIGLRCRIAAHATTKSGSRIGDGNQISEVAVLGGDPQDISYCGERNYLTIGENNILREGVTLHRSSRSRPFWTRSPSTGLSQGRVEAWLALRPDSAPGLGQELLRVAASPLLLPSRHPRSVAAGQKVLPRDAETG